MKDALCRFWAARPDFLPGTIALVVSLLAIWLLHFGFGWQV